METDNLISYYKVNDIKFKYFTDAINHKRKLNNAQFEIEWEFNFENELKANDWNIEPHETLDQLYFKRAKELREKYDYIILYYSGGSDSHNVLMSFYNQGLHIDEIQTSIIGIANRYLTFDIDDPKSISAQNFEAEYELNVINKLKFIKTHMPKTKISIFDSSKFITKTISTLDENNADSWINIWSGSGHISQHLKINIFYSIENKRLFENKTKICILTGADKPKIEYNEDGFLYFRFNDASFNWMNPTAIKESDQYKRIYFEAFYWNKSTIRMLTKQLYTVKSFLSKNPNYIKYWGSPKSSLDPLYAIKFSNNIRNIQEPILRKILYTTWDNGFQTNKSFKSFYGGQYDTWFMKFIEDNFPEKKFHIDKIIDNFSNIFPKDRYDNTLSGVKIIKNNNQFKTTKLYSKAFKTILHNCIE